MKITEVYQKYKIPPQLQLHQLRVAAVAKQICNDFDNQLDEEAIIKACLLHDMANIIKFDLTKFPEFLEPEGPDYWQSVKDDYVKKYGPDEHQASVQIAQELGMSDYIKKCVESISFSNSVANAAQTDLAIKICDYADNRVGPYGVISLEARFADLRERYGHWAKERGNNAPTREFEAAVRQIEEQIFAHTKIKPADITAESSAAIIDQLKTYEI